MLAWVVIDRTHSRQTSPPSFFLGSHSRFGLTPPSSQKNSPLSFYALTRNSFCNPFVFKSMHVMGGCTPLPNLPTFEPSNVPTCFQAIPFLFKPLRTLLHLRKTQLFSFQGLPHSLREITRGGGCLWLTSSLLGSTFRRSNLSTFKRFNVFSLPRFSPSRRTVAFPQHDTARPLCSAPPGRTIEVHAGAKLASRPWPPRSFGR